MDTNHQFDIGVFAPCGKNVVDIACKTSQKIQSLIRDQLRLFKLQMWISAYLGALPGSLYGTYTSPLVHENLAKNKQTTSAESIQQRRGFRLKIIKTLNQQTIK